LIEAAASLKSFCPKDGPRDQPPPDDPGNPTVNFRGERRSNATHQSTTDAEARLARKGKGREAKLSFLAHVLMENRNGLLVDFALTQATCTAERETAPKLADAARERGFHPRTLGADKNYDTRECFAELRQQGVTPRVAQNTRGRRSAIDGRTTSWPGYAISQRIGQRVEEVFGWMKTTGGFRRTRYCVDWSGPAWPDTSRLPILHGKIGQAEALTPEDRTGCGYQRLDPRLAGSLEGALHTGRLDGRRVITEPVRRVLRLSRARGSAGDPDGDTSRRNCVRTAFTLRMVIHGLHRLD
jgi:hypothetical protein